MSAACIEKRLMTSLVEAYIPAVFLKYITKHIYQKQISFYKDDDRNETFCTKTSTEQSSFLERSNNPYTRAHSTHFSIVRKSGVFQAFDHGDPCELLPWCVDADSNRKNVLCRLSYRRIVDGGYKHELSRRS